MANGVGAGQLPPDYLYRQLSKFPLGLLRYFGIPSGANPQEIRTDYQPVLDLWEWLGTTNAEYAQTPGAVVLAGAAGSQLIGAVTSSQIQWVRDFTIRSTPVGAGGGVMTGFPAIQVQAGSGVEVITGDGSGVSNAGEIFMCRASDPYFLGPNAVGHSIIIGRNTLVNNITLFGYFRYVNLSF